MSSIACRDAGLLNHRRSTALQQYIVADHADRHRNHKCDDRKAQPSEIDEGRSRAKSDQAPPNSKQPARNQQLGVYVCSCWPKTPLCQNWRATSPCDGKAETRDSYGAGHHKGERRIPRAEEVEEAEHLCWISHSGNQEACAEDQPAG